MAEARNTIADWTSYTVTHTANLFDDPEPGRILAEFKTLRQAQRYADANGAQVVEVIRDGWDARPGTFQEGCDDNGDPTIRGSWTGRTYYRNFGIEWAYVELKLCGEKAAQWFGSR